MVKPRPLSTLDGDRFQGCVNVAAQIRLLAPLYAAFTEGLAARDLVEAKALPSDAGQRMPRLTPGGCTVRIPDQISGPLIRRLDMARTLPISEVKTHLPRLLRGVEEREEEIVVTRKGRPAAVLLSYAEHERLKATLDVLGDRALMRQVRRSLRFYGEGKRGLSFERVFGEPLRPRRRRAR